MIDGFLALITDPGFLASFGYIGVFLAGFLSTFSLFLPSPTFIAVFLLATTLNPLLLGIIGGLGAGVGELIGYGVGVGANKVLKRKYKKYIDWANELFEKYHPNVVIFVLAAAPVFPFDVAGIFCGTINYNIKHFSFYLITGKILKYLILAYAGFFGLNFFMGLLG